MAVTEIPLQIDLFTGHLVDTRTSDQKRRDTELRIPTQLLMFSQRDIAQIGVSPTPRMDLSPGRLALIAEDPRTDEEKERDRLQAAQKQTLELFAGESSTETLSARTDFTPPDMTIESPTEVEENDEDEPDILSQPVEPPLTKLAAYYALIASIKEASDTQKVSEPILLAQNIAVSLAIHRAKRAGLMDAEITAAQAIGSFVSSSPVELSLPTITTNEPAPKSVEIDSDIPILWVKMADLLKRRPDLAEEIEQLDDDEFAFLAERVGDALEEFYWIQLNVVLSLFLDRQLALHLNFSKRRKHQKRKIQKAP